MRVYITAPAIADLSEIEAFISKDNISAAENLIHHLEKRCLSLANNPNLGRRRDYLKPGLRTITEARNYLICYRIKQNSIEILRVLHGARDIEKIIKNI